MTKPLVSIISTCTGKASKTQISISIHYNKKEIMNMKNMPSFLQSKFNCCCIFSITNWYNIPGNISLRFAGCLFVSSVILWSAFFTGRTGFTISFNGSLIWALATRTAPRNIRNKVSKILHYDCGSEGLQAHHVETFES